MKENNEQTKPLTPLQEKFVLHWGKMGTQWGINRTVAQIHALLFLSPEPVNAEQIAETLSVARSNVSTSLWELQSWGIIKVVAIKGDRRDHYESIKDVWELFRIVLDERKKREIDPTLALLKECVVEADQTKADSHTKERFGELLNFFESTRAWYSQIRQLPTKAVIKFLKAGDKVFKMLGLSSE